MLLPVLAVAGTGVVTFRASAGALEYLSKESLDEAKPIENVRDLLVRADDLGEGYVESEDPALGKSFLALSERIDEAFVQLSTLSTQAERELASSARLLWEDAFAAAGKAASGGPEVRESELDLFHDALDEAASLTANLYSLNVTEIAGEISSLRLREQVQLLAGLAILIVSSIVVFIMARRLGRSITTPVLALEEAAARFGSDDLSHRIPVKGDDELAHVGHAFNAMAGKLHRSIEELRDAREKVERLNAYLEQRVVARTRDLEEANRDLLEAKEKAEQASRAKSEFLSRTSHELRTPLNAILGFGQLLETSTLTPYDRECVDQILTGGRRLLELINEVLDISEFESRRLAVSVEPVSVAEVVSESVDFNTPLAKARNVELQAGALDPSWYVLADRHRLRQVLQNLLSNAVKFNREGGTVRVSSVKSSGETFSIHVADTGRGIASEHLERLFSPFDRLGAERTDSDGTGLGLALSKALVEAMGGRIVVDSRVGQGSTFSVELHEANAEPVGHPAD
jgi:signal transduction histidine kinase